MPVPETADDRYAAKPSDTLKVRRAKHIAHCTEIFMTGCSNTLMSGGDPWDCDECVAAYLSALGRWRSAHVQR